MKATHELQYFLEEIYLRRSEDFSGIGLIIYESILNLPIVSLKSIDSSIHLPMVLKSEIIEFLTNSSRNSSKYHDGFHLLNKNFELTHISQFVAPPIFRDIKPKNEFGSRFRTAMYTSMLPNVIACGVLSKNYPPTILVNGIEL